MTEEIVFKLGVEGQDLAKGAKGAEKDINDANKSIKKSYYDLAKEVRKTEKVIEELTKSQGKNSKAVKEQEEALEGLKRQMDSVSKSDLGKTFEDIYGEVKPLSTQVGEMEDRMHALALENKQNTEEYKRLEKEVVRYKTAIRETDMAVDRLVEQGSGLGAALQLGETVVAGYGAVQGAMALAGVENENLQETFVKLQAVQAVLAGIEQLRLNLNKQSLILTTLQTTATKAWTAAKIAFTAATSATTVAMKVLRIAMLALPIVAIIAGIAALVGWIVSLFSETEKAEEMNKRLTASLEKQREAMDRSTASLKRNVENRIRLRKAEGASREELHELELEKLATEESSRRRNLAFEQKSIRAKTRVYKQALKEENSELAKQIKDEIKASKKRYRDLKALDGQYQIDKLILEKEFSKETEKIRDRDTKDQEKRYNDHKRQQEEKLKLEKELQRKIRDLYIASIKDQDIREMEALKENQKREREDLKERFKNNTELLIQLEIRQAQELQELRDAQAKKITSKQKEQELKRLEFQKKLQDKFVADRKSQLEGELIQMREDFDATMALRQELLDLERANLLSNKELTQGEKFKIEQEYAQKSKDLETEKAEHSKAMQEAAAKQRVEIEQGALNSIAALSDAVFAIRDRNIKEGSKEEEKAAKRRFYFNKAVQLGGALIDAQKAITASLAQAPIAIGGIPNPAGIASLVFASTQSAAAIATILAQQYESSTSGGGQTISPPSVPTAQNQNDQGTSTLTEGLKGNENQTGVTKLNIVGSELQTELDNQSKAEIISTIG